jgi:uncharacterized protein
MSIPVTSSERGAACAVDPQSPLAASQPKDSGLAVAAPVWTRGDTIRTIIAALVIVALIVTANIIGNIPEFGTNASTSLLIGTALGIAFERGRFCFFCIFRDGLNRRFNSGLLAIFTAIAVGSIGYTVLYGLFLPVPGEGAIPSAAHIGPVSWALVLGATAFGIGMPLAGACISGQFYRLSQGYIRAIPGLIGVIFGFILSFNSWNFLYENSIKDAPVLWLPDAIGYTGSLTLTLVVLAALSFWAIKTANQKELFKPSNSTYEWSTVRHNLIKRRWSPFATGGIIGVIGVFAYLRMEPLGTTRQLNSIAQSISSNYNLAPELVGLDGLAGCIGAAVEVITNNGWLVIGLFVAAVAASISGNRFKPEWPTLKGTVSSLIGGTLLGWGSFTSLGCTIGNLLSGTQAFAVSGWVFFLFAFLGTWLGLKLKFDKFV